MQGMAQKGSWAVDLQGGPSFSNLYGSSYAKHLTNSTGAYSFGAEMHYRWNAHWGIVASPSFEQIETKMAWDYFIMYPDMPYDLPVGGVPQKEYPATPMRLNYIQLPVQLEYRMGTGRLHSFVSAGAFAGMRAGPTPKAPGDAMPADFQPMNAGVSAGAGLEWSIYRHLALQVAVRDDLGLVDVLKESEFYNGPLRTQVLNVLGGLVWEFKH